ncbi:FapA family protein [Treponema sp.]|uniref:FapA family protein n=1 Tax=Treponema sp. TaxID=166 RepID=UPI0025D1DEA7|nr:FapA family protein [Treponema sp.]MCR5217234.1 FapA family protein [Treponema sp.]
MVNLDRLRLDMEKRLAKDREIHTVEVMADTLDECLADAAVQLETSVSNLEYEVIEKGFAGIIGLAKKPWKISVYENPDVTDLKKKQSEEQMFADDQLTEEIKVVDKDGYYYIHRFDAGLFLKVVNPVGNGKKVAAKEVISSLKRADTISVDENAVKEACEGGTNGEYKEVGVYEHVAAGDAIMSVDVSKDEMQVTITVSPPAAGGAEITEDQIRRSVATQGVVAGIEDDKIKEFIDNPVYNMPYEVAAAVQPVDGRDAYIAYNFETDRSKLKLKESETGQVNFKELNLIQNVVAGQPLAQKMLPQRGKGGKTVFGRYLEAKNGKDMPIPLGLNVKLDSDGRTVVAEKNGQVMLVNGKITVEEVYEVQGVNLKTGNITFMGTVICRGNVEDGFDIKADGNIEVYGSVGNCHLEAEGDIVISQGIMGRDEGTVTTPKSVWARFIQNAKVKAGDYIVVNDNIMNSEVSAMKKILVRGKRAQIIGGHLFATEEISAKNIGSPGGGTETVLEVGFDPEKKQRLMELMEMQSNLMKQLEDVDLNIATLENQKEIRRSLPREKEESLVNLRKQKEEITEQSNDMSKEITEIQERLRELRVVGKVNASGTVYAGTKIFVRDEKDEVKSDVKACSFYFEDGFVRRGKFDATQVTQEVEGPSGYTTD